MSEKMIRKFYTYGENFKLLKLEKVWARSIDVLYRLGVAITVLYFGYALYADSYLHDLFSVLYALVAMTTVLTGGILAYHIFLYSLLYILYGNDLQKKNSDSSAKLSVFLIFITGTFLVAGLTWLYLGP